MSFSEMLLPEFDQEMANTRKTLELFLKPWSFLIGGNLIFTISKLATIRTWVMNHTIHHRAQLGVYLRLNDVPVPGMYGPTADEGGM